MSCEHSTRKTRCRVCKGGSICSHDVRRTDCKICNPAGYLKNIVSGKISYYLKNNKLKRTTDYLGCSIQELKEHLEKQFKDGISWENYGKMWHIDHMIPIQYNKPNIEQVKYRLNYNNLQPLTIGENTKKGNRYCV
jgi:hypothetical protein